MFGKIRATFYIVHPDGETACYFKRKVKQILIPGVIVVIPWPDGYSYNFDRHGLSYFGQKMCIDRSVFDISRNSLKIILNSGLTPDKIEELKKIKTQNSKGGYHRYEDTFCEGGAW